VSSRVYSGTYADQRPGPGGFGRFLPWALALLTIGLQIAFPLLEPGERAGLTTATVVSFFLASATHAWINRGAIWTVLYLAITLGIGFGVEYLGSSSGWPFGDYAYTEELTPVLLGVPVVIPLAWAMMAYPALVVGRRLATHPVVVAVIGAWALASWDLFLDPMMVGEDYWVWDDGNGPEIPGLDGIPALNLLGWAGVALVMMALLDRLGRRTADDRQPAVMYLWTYLGGIIANAFFLDRPGVALVGAIGMGLVALPFAWSLWNER
jgi:uncharacterized membrane protein